MRLLTNPSSRDDGGEHSQARLGGQVGKIVFLLSRRAVFADEPGLVPRQMLLTLVPDPLRWSVGRAHTHSRKAAFELSLRAAPPPRVLPPGIPHPLSPSHPHNFPSCPPPRTPPP